MTPSLNAWIGCCLLASFICLACSGSSWSQVFDERFEDWPIDLKIDGTIVACDSLDSLLALDGWSDSLADEELLLVSSQGEHLETIADQLKAKGCAVHSVSLEQLAIGDLTKSIVIWSDDRNATAVSTGERERLQTAFDRHLRAQGTLVVVGPQIRLLSKVAMVDDEEGRATVKPGLNLFPDCILEVVEALPLHSYKQTETPKRPGTVEDSLSEVLTAHPRCVGVRVMSGSALTLRGRKLQVFGGRAELFLPPDDQVGLTSQIIREPRSPRESPSKWLIDLTQWRRRAIDHTLEPFPPEMPQVPEVPNGTLIIAGGGGLPSGLMEEFVELAGGIERAKLVYVPCEEEDEVSDRQGQVESWRQMGVKVATFIHTKDRKKANQDDAFLEPLKNATGIWFGGGRQWNFADSYYGTQAHRLMKEVLHRGGVIGGSSAGASIQARYLARATPIENVEIIAPGYERGGLGFIAGVAIDQHFSQRRRHADMTQLINRYPQLLGIGIDEETAIVVQKSMARVIGAGKVHFYDSRRSRAPGDPDYEALAEGESYDLAKREIID
jgi:cyanophycinase